MGVREAAVVAIAEGQKPLDAAKLAEWAGSFGIGVTLFTNWEGIVDQALFWAGDPKPTTANRAVRCIHDRLVAVEATPEAVALWKKLTQKGGREEPRLPEGGR